MPHASSDRTFGALALMLGVACGCGAPPSQPAEEMPARSSEVAQPASGFTVDPFWPQPLPDGWLLGNVVGVATDSRDNVWIIHRPNSQSGAADTPSVIAFSPDGAIAQSWGGPGDGYDWGTQTHGIYVDHEDNVWVGFGGGLPYNPSAKTTTDNALVLKFTPDGQFLLQLGDQIAILCVHHRQGTQLGTALETGEHLVILDHQGTLVGHEMLERINAHIHGVFHLVKDILVPTGDRHVIANVRTNLRC